MTDTTERPLVTFALFAYNQEQYIREAVEGAFSQTYEPLEIILSDDCSSDRTFEIMQEMAAAYQGPHRVRVRRSEVNRAVLHHLLSVAREVTGEIMVVGAGDDISLPNRTSVLMSELMGSEYCAASSDDVLIDEFGNNLERDEERFAHRDKWHNTTQTWVHGATASYRTSFLRELPLPDGQVFYEDMVLSDAMLLTGRKALRIRLPLVRYRYHSSNLSNREIDRSSFESIEKTSIIRWQRAYYAKQYNYDFYLQQNVDISPKIAKRLYNDMRVLQLMGNWARLGFTERLELLLRSLSSRQVSAAVSRVFGENAFYLSRRVKRLFL